MVGGGRQQCSKNSAPLGHQDVVGPARRGCGHALEADPLAGDADGYTRMQEALERSSAEQHQIGTQAGNRRKVLRIEFLKVLRSPRLKNTLGHDKEASGVLFRVDFDPSVAVPGDCVQGG